MGSLKALQLKRVKINCCWWGQLLAAGTGFETTNGRNCWMAPGGAETGSSKKDLYRSAGSSLNATSTRRGV
jgi:hypothetical protein